MLQDFFLKIKIKRSLAKQVKVFLDQKLALEVEDLVRQMDELSASLLKARSLLIRDLEQHIREAIDLEGVALSEYGSFKTGLLTPFSDVDLLIENQEVLDREQTVSILQQVESSLQGKSFIEKINGIYSAQIPVLKINTKQTIGQSDIQLRVDLVLS